jgi:pantetheine-phosphate adenylyltransferase
MQWIKSIFAENSKIHVVNFQGLTATFCKSLGAGYLIRGIRNASDFDYEKTISQINHTLVENLETVFLIARPELSHISSTIVRELILGKADLTAFVPDKIHIEL